MQILMELEPDMEQWKELEAPPKTDSFTVEQIEGMKVDQLRVELKKRNLDTKGRKQVLINRLKSSVSKEEVSPKPAVPVKIEVEEKQPGKEEEKFDAEVELDLVFVVDCTGSMGSYIASAQQVMKCKKIVLLVYRTFGPLWKKSSLQRRQMFDLRW